MLASPLCAAASACAHPRQAGTMRIRQLSVVLLAVQDTIPRGGKFFSAYKRNGQQVVVNKIGDIVMRPTLRLRPYTLKLNPEP